MNIEELSGYISTNQMSKSNSINKSDIRKNPAEGSSIRDNVNMSELSRMMSEKAKDLANLHKLRPEKILQFQNSINNPPELADSVVDTILQRMTI